MIKRQFCQYVYENEMVCEQINAEDCLVVTLACVDAPADMLRLDSLYFMEEGGQGPAGVEHDQRSGYQPLSNMLNFRL